MLKKMKLLIARIEYELALQENKNIYQVITDHRWYSKGLRDWKQHKAWCELARLKFHTAMRWPHVTLLEEESRIESGM